MYPALIEVNLMPVLNGMGRAEEQWTKLLSHAGLEVVRFCSAAPESKEAMRFQRSVDEP